MRKEIPFCFSVMALIAAIGLAYLGRESMACPAEGLAQRVPTPTATPKATFTPTPQPGGQLRAARIRQGNGDYEGAIAEYKAVLAGQATAEEIREARFRLGECYLLNGDHKAAIGALQGFLRAHPEDERRPLALFSLARAYEGLEDWHRAIAYYRRYLTKRDIIASYVHELIGDCYIELKDYPKAIAEYEEALRDAHYAAVFELMEKIAQAYASLEDYEQAIAWYEAILEKARLYRYRAWLEYMIGRAYQEWGKAEEAQEHFLEAVNRYPRSEHAYLALVEVVEAGVEVDEFQRGLVDYYAGAYGPAIRALRRYIELAKPTSLLDDAHYYLGLAQRGSGNFTSALREFDFLIEAYPESEHWGRAWLEKAGALAELRAIEEAVQVYRDFAEIHPHHELAEEALWLAARLMEEDGRYDEAAEFYLDLQAEFPQGKRTEEALFRAGLCYYRLASYEKAEEAWQELPKAQRSKALFWIRKSLLHRGRIRQAKICFEEAAELDGYYALRAQAISKRLSRVTFPFESEVLPTKEMAGQMEAERWLANWLGTPENQLGELYPSIAEDPRFKRGRELLRVGLWKEAQRELKDLARELADSPLALYQLALSFRQMGLVRLSIFCLEKLIQLSPAESIGDIPAFLQRLIYPLHFDEVVMRESRANGLDPLLFFALIRQESGFDKHATSSAGARGLSQIIPATGEWIALNLGKRGYRADDLYRPCLNVKFGAWYLAQQIKEFGGSILVALAAYNGGPHRARRWLEKAAGDEDLFLETISLAQPYLYVKRVYEQYAMYRSLYRKASTWAMKRGRGIIISKVHDEVQLR